MGNGEQVGTRLDSNSPPFVGVWSLELELELGSWVMGKEQRAEETCQPAGQPAPHQTDHMEQGSTGKEL